MLGYRVLNPLGLACGFLGGGEGAGVTTSYETKMLLEVVSDKIVFVKLKTRNNFEQNNDETH
jgi:hypothetical protein